VEDGSPKPPNQAEAAAQSLKAALIGLAAGGSNAKLDVSADGTVTVSGGSLNLNDSAIIPAGVTLKVADDGTLAVPASKKLVVTGDLEVEGGISVPASAEIEVGTGATYILKSDASGTNEGTVTVKAGGTIYSGAPIAISGAGTNVVEGGGTVYFNDTGAGDPFIGSITNGNAIFQVPAGSTFSYDNDKFIVDGSVTLNKYFLVSARDEQLQLTASSTLTVKAELRLRNSWNDGGGFAAYGVVGGSSSQILITTGSINVSKGDGGAPNESNFTDDGNTVVGGTGDNAIPGSRSYTWTTGMTVAFPGDSSHHDGWKKD
jgi:hypothetical protein